MRSVGVRVTALMLVAVLVAVGVSWLAGSTRDASSSALPARALEAAPVSIRGEGRVVAYPGFDVTLGADITGTIDEVRVHEGQAVKRGDVLVVLRADELRAELAEARAAVAETRAELRLARVTEARRRTLHEDGVASAEELDRSVADTAAVAARIGQHEARVQRIEAALEKTEISAPIDGVCVERFVHPGESITPGTRLLRLANLDRIRIEAEIDEFDLTAIHLGDAAVVRVEGSDRTWNGRIEELPPVVTARKLKPQDPGRPTDVRVMLAKIALDDTAALRLEQRVEVDVRPGKR